MVRAVVASACFAVAGLVAATPASAATYSCTPPSYPDTKNGGYFSGPNGSKKIKVSGYARRSACKAGRAAVLAHYRCRRATGIKATCNKTIRFKVNGRTQRLRCSERRNPDLQSSTEVNGAVTCSRGSKKVRFIFQQNL
ncbi:MAG TPA: hypothetical protein VGR11_17220 [Solirubrobacteraceae bacterium]|nr:hypothetical protein [Solirubrobacteraceae bacterium]